MLQKQFIGYVRTNIISNAIVPPACNSQIPPGEICTGNNCTPLNPPPASPAFPGIYVQLGGPNATSTNNPFTIPISWDSPPPFPTNLSKTINDLNNDVKNSNLGITTYETETVFTITSGTQGGNGDHSLSIYGYNVSGTTPTNIANFVTTIYASPPNQFILITRPDSRYCFSSCPSSKVIPTSFFRGGFMLLNLLTQIDRSNCKFPLRDLSVEIEIKVTLVTSCGGSNLTVPNSICLSYCNENEPDCFNQYIDYCFEGIGNNANIYKDEGCRNFFANYNTKYGPRAELDIELNKYCVAKYPGGLPELNVANDIDKTLCGCHMTPEEYKKFADELAAALNFPGATTFGIESPCFFPPCASSVFKTASIGKVCNVPQCLNIAAFNNNGTLDSSKIVINQSADCVNSKQTGNGNNGNTTINNTTKVLIGGGVVLVVIVVIVIIIVIATSGSKK